MLIIRLQRVGKKNQPSFRIVLAEKHRAVKKEVVEILGHYNPRTKDFAVRDPERVKYWISQHVEISPTVNNLFIDKGLLTGQKVKAWKPKKQAQTKADLAQTAADKIPTGGEAKKEEAAPASPTATVGEASKAEETNPEEKPTAE